MVASLVCVVASSQQVRFLCVVASLVCVVASLVCIVAWSHSN